MRLDTDVLRRGAEIVRSFDRGFAMMYGSIEPGSIAAPDEAIARKGGGQS